MKKIRFLLWPLCLVNMVFSIKRAKPYSDGAADRIGSDLLMDKRGRG